MNFKTDLRAYHGDVSVQAKYVARARGHQLADEIDQGTYYDDSGPKLRVCPVGCTIHGSDHTAYEEEIGVPEILARIEDRLFEMMPLEDAKQWPVKFLEAIPVGADLSMVWPKLAVWMLADPTDGVIRFAKHDDVKKVITDVAQLYELVIAGAEVDDNTWWTAR